MTTSSPVAFIGLDPDKDLEFQKPFTKEIIKNCLDVVNKSTENCIAFKVKTTAPKQYCVRPNSGRIGPNARCQVQVLLQTMKDDPSDDFKCKDRFLVQGIRIPNDLMALSNEDAQSRLLELWAQAEQLKKSDPVAALEILCEQKLKCAYLPAAIDPSAVAVVVPDEQDQSAANPASELPPATTTATVPLMNVAQKATGDANTTKSSGTSKELLDARDNIQRLSAACDGYKAEIDRLNGLRQRKPTTSGSGSSSNVRTIGVHQGDGAVSFQIAAIIALVSFFLGILLF